MVSLPGPLTRPGHWGAATRPEVCCMSPASVGRELTSFHTNAQARAAHAVLLPGWAFAGDLCVLERGLVASTVPTLALLKATVWPHRPVHGSLAVCLFHSVPWTHVHCYEHPAPEVPARHLKQSLMHGVIYKMPYAYVLCTRVFLCMHVCV